MASKLRPAKGKTPPPASTFSAPSRNPICRCLLELLLLLVQKTESRRRRSLEDALHEAEARYRESGRHDGIDAVAAANEFAAEAEAAAAAAVESSAETVVDLRGHVSRARERAEILEDRLHETMRSNRRLEREVAEAVELGASKGFTVLLSTFFFCSDA